MNWFNSVLLEWFILLLALLHRVPTIVTMNDFTPIQWFGWICWPDLFGIKACYFLKLHQQIWAWAYIRYRILLLQSVTRIGKFSEMIILYHFLPLKKRATFFLGRLVITWNCLLPKTHHHGQVTLSKAMIHMLWLGFISVTTLADRIAAINSLKWLLNASSTTTATFLVFIPTILTFFAFSHPLPPVLTYNL